MDYYRIDISEPAEDDLRDILRYISSQLLAPETSLELLETIDDAIQTLSLMPHRIPLVDDERLALLGYLILPVRNFLVFFSINETGKKKVVDVERVLYYRRDWKNLL